MSSRRLSPRNGRGTQNDRSPEISISSDDEGAVVTREDGDRIFATASLKHRATTRQRTKQRTVLFGSLLSPEARDAWIRAIEAAVEEAGRKSGRA